MMALIGTPFLSSHFGWMIGHWPAGAQKRELGWAALPGIPIFHGWLSQVLMETACM